MTENNKEKPLTVQDIYETLIPAMKEDKYPAEYAAAVSAASATIGPVIPPSIPLVVYGLSAGASVGKLFVAGIIPGLAMGVFLIAASVIISHSRGYPAGEWRGFSEIARSAAGSLFTPSSFLSTQAEWLRPRKSARSPQPMPLSSRWLSIASSPSAGCGRHCAKRRSMPAKY